MSFFGGGRSSQPATPSQQTQFVREAPGIEERKIELMDQKLSSFFTCEKVRN